MDTANLEQDAGMETELDATEVGVSGEEGGEEEFESEARLQGWVPKERFRGREQDWVDAETFVKRGRELNPILRSNNERLSSQLRDSSARIEKLEKQLAFFSQRQAKTEESTLDEHLEDLLAAQMIAVEEKDTQAYRALAKEITQVQNRIERLNTPVKREEFKPEPELESWIHSNNWFGKDQVRTSLALEVGQEIREQYPNLIGEEFLEVLGEELQVQYPNKFGRTKGRRSNSPMVEDSVPSRTFGRRGKSAADLPADARAAMKEFVTSKLGTEKEYLEIYFGN